jgi:predicted transcriptional regulator
MAHLQDLHPMTKSGHFKTLHKHGFIEKRARGSYRLSKKGWTLLAVAYKHSMDAKLPKPDPDAHGMDWIG